MIKKYGLIVINIMALTLVCFQTFFNVHFLLGMLSGILFMVTSVCLIKSAIKNGAADSWTMAAIIILAMVSVCGSIIYYFYQLNQPVIMLLAILISGFSIGARLWHGRSRHLHKIPKINTDWRQSLTILSYFVLLGFIVKLLMDARSDISVPTPWTLIDQKIFICYFLATLILFIFLLKTELKNFWKKIFLSIHFLMSFSVSMIVYQLGFGFDPFIHQKTAQIIADHGYILPKPFYYLGQYALEVFVHKITLLPIDLIDRLLVPLLAAVFIPAIAVKSFRSVNAAAILAFLALPFSFLTFTTPQNLSLLFVLLTAMTLYRYLARRDISWRWPLAMALIALSIHPLSGLPALILCVGSRAFIDPAAGLPAKIFRIAYLAMAAAAIPLAFLATRFINNYPLNLFFEWRQIKQTLGIELEQLIYFKNNFRGIYDLIYFYGFNWQLMTLLLIGASIFIFRRHLDILYDTDKTSIVRRLINIYLVSGTLLAVDYLILKLFFSFDALIYYEKNDYASRLTIIMIIFLTPLILPIFSKIFIRFKTKPGTLIAIGFLAAMLVSTSFYLSYPRYDNIEANHGLNVGKYDFLAATFIHNSGADPYIVLASQNTAVAAVKLYGFEPEYNGHFYYPLPTGSRLYDSFLNIVNDRPKTEYIEQARQLTGVQTVYLVIPKYWDRFENLNNMARAIAAETYDIDGQIYIYRFD
ncbi:MAG: hypothetical protein ACOZBH_05085 [Patescibacteria group bacterium]